MWFFFTFHFSIIIFHVCFSFLDRHGLDRSDKINRLQELLIQALQHEINAAHPDEVGLFPRLLMSISSLRELGVEHRKMLESLKGQIRFQHDLYAETFDLIT